MCSFSILERGSEWRGRRKRGPQARKWVFAMHRRTDGQVTGAGTGISGDKMERFPCGNCCNFDSTTSMVERLIAILLLLLHEEEVDGDEGGGVVVYSHYFPGRSFCNLESVRILLINQLPFYLPIIPIPDMSLKFSWRFNKPERGKGFS